MPSSVNLPLVRVATVGFAGGVNIRDAANLMQPNEVRPIENIVFDERGGGSKRRGVASLGTFGSTGTRVLSMYTFLRDPNFAPQIIMHTTDGVLLYTNDPTVSPPVWTTIASGLSTSSPMSYETFLDKCYMSNGVDPYCAWNGAAFQTFTSAPKGKYLRLWKDTMWVSGVPGQDDRVYSSAPGDAETFPISTWVDVFKGDGDAVRALTMDGNYLVVGKRNRTFVIYDPVLFSNRVVDFEKGFESHFAVAQFEGYIYFISRRGICEYVGDAPSVVLSENIDPVFTAEMIALDRLSQATVYTFLNRIGFAIPESDSPTGNSLVIEYYPRLGAYTPLGRRLFGPFSFHRMPVQAFARWRYGQKDQLYAAHNNANKFTEVFAPVGTDDGQSFQAVLQTSWFNFGDPINSKYLRELRLICTGRFDLMIYRDFEESVYRTVPVDASGAQDFWDSVDDKWDTRDTWGKDEPIRDVRLRNLDAYARWFSFRFQDAMETGTNHQTFWIGSHGRDLLVGEWAIFGLFGEAYMLGRR
jgi:hypothetical protein